MKTKNYSRNPKKRAMEKKPLIIALISLGAIGVLVLLLIFGPGIFAGKAIYTGVTPDTAGISEISAVQNNEFNVTIGAHLGSDLTDKSILYSFALSPTPTNSIECGLPTPIISATDKTSGCQESDYVFARGPTSLSFIG